jgi:hypothetical protein
VADTPSIPQDDPLTEIEIKELLSGRTFEFVAFDEPITGTTNWDFEEGIVSGSFIWDKSEKGTFETEIRFEGDQLCTIQNRGTICQIVYPYEAGFMEVTPDGVVHAVSSPMD